MRPSASSQSYQAEAVEGLGFHAPFRAEERFGKHELGKVVEQKENAVHLPLAWSRALRTVHFSSLSRWCP